MKVAGNKALNSKNPAREEVRRVLETDWQLGGGVLSVQSGDAGRRSASLRWFEDTGSPLKKQTFHRSAALHKTHSYFATPWSLLAYRL